MRAIKACSLLALLAIGLAWGFPAAGQQDSDAPTPVELELGAKVYEKHCKSCHLEKGKSRIRRLNLSDDQWKHGNTLEEIKKTITDGIEASQMQPFKSKLTPEEVAAVAKYVKTLAQPEQPTSDKN